MQANNFENHSQLTVRDISKIFKSRKVVDSVSLSVASGEVVGLLGPNGAGKTTTFNVIIGLESCDVGSVELNGNKISNLPVHSRARLGIGYLPQEASVFRKLSVEDNIRAILENRNNLNRQRRKEELEFLLELFSLKPIRKSLGITLSGGERRRVELARTLATNPHFILLDEPFSGVDPIAVADVIAQIQFLQHHGIGVLITDHNVRETLPICSRAYILADGRVISAGTPQEILFDPVVRDRYLGTEFVL